MGVLDIIVRLLDQFEIIALPVGMLLEDVSYSELRIQERVHTSSSMVHSAVWPERPATHLRLVSHCM
jgi:hypothetical protein